MIGCSRCRHRYTGRHSARHTNGKPSPSASILRPDHGTTQRPSRSFDSSVQALLAPGGPGRRKQLDRQAHVVGMMVGTALMFIGFLDVFLSISGGFEINVVPLLIYFSGIAVWANAVVENPTIRYSLMAGSVLISLAFFHYGEVLFWHKQVVFWSTVASSCISCSTTPSRRPEEPRTFNPRSSPVNSSLLQPPDDHCRHHPGSQRSPLVSTRRSPTRPRSDSTTSSSSTAAVPIETCADRRSVPATFRTGPSPLPHAPPDRPRQVAHGSSTPGPPPPVRGPAVPSRRYPTPANARQAISTALSDKACVGGRFDVRFDSPRR
jgi:hypothetical protein